MNLIEVKAAANRLVNQNAPGEITRTPHQIDCYEVAKALESALLRLEMTRRDTLLEAAQAARNRYKTWRMPNPDDAEPNEVCDDATACENIAEAILSLGRS